MDGHATTASDTDFRPIASSDKYIQLNKKITNKDVIKEIALICQRTLLTPTEVCYRLISEGAIYNRQRRENFEKEFSPVR